MNILCMGGRTVGAAVAWDLVQTFLAAPVQPGRSALASAEQGGVPGSRNRHKVGTRCFIMNG